MRAIRSLILPLILLLCSCLFADIVFYGDTRSDEVTHRKVVNAIISHKPAIAFHTGDLNQKGIVQSEYDLFKEISKPLSKLCPIYPAKGNHERSLSLFLANFPALNDTAYYSLVHDGIRFIVLDSTGDLSPASGQYKWLQTALADTLPAILILHHPVFSSGAHGDELGLQLWLPQMLQGSNVRAVFSGHDHNYERSEYEGISYVVCGGGGAPMREARNVNPQSVIFELSHHYIVAKRVYGRLTCKVWNLESELLDSFELSGF
jgi:hypothetical protein